MKMKYYNRHRLSDEVEAKYSASYCPTLHHLLANPDVVSIHCPLNAKTIGLIGEKEFAVMKDGSFLVNIARGAIIDEGALKAALNSGKIARVGLDVFCNEPHNIDAYFLESDKVIVQPHVGALTDVAFHKAEKECFENVRAFFERGMPNSPVKMEPRQQT
jgi:lactate dehydrogenase-like 2-hydroxyacid dehydrogenase